MLPVNVIRDPRAASRGARSEVSVRLLAALEGGNREGQGSQSDRNSVWDMPHERMAAAVRDGSLPRFQEDSRVADHICHGGGEIYLQRIAERYGQERLSFFLSTYRETLCGEPQDITCVQGCYITRTAMRHLYHLAVLHGFSRDYYGRAVNFVEIGGGFGNLARLARQYRLAERYYIVDVPVSLVAQMFYLTEFFGGDEVALWDGTNYLHGSEDSPICLLPPHAIELLSVVSSPTFLVSTMALTETPRSIQDEYLEKLRFSTIYVYGQTLTNYLGGSTQLSGSDLDNANLFYQLSKTCHVVEWSQADYYSELLGINIT